MNDNTFTTIYDLLFSTTLTQNEDIINYVINQLYLCNDLDVDERNTLNSYIALRNEVKGQLDSKTLVSRNVAFTTSKSINESSLENLTDIFISNKKKMKFTSEATNIIMDITKPGSTLKDAQERLLTLIDKSDISNNENEELVKAYSEDLLENILNKEEIHGIPFGIDFIDSVYPGTTPNSFTVLAGYTGSMKTTLAVNHCFINMLNGKNVVYFSLEISKEDLIVNLMSLYTISCTKEPIKRDEINKIKYRDKEKFRQIFKDLMSLPGKIQIYDETDIESYSHGVFNNLIHKTDKMFKEDTGNGISLIVLDHAQLLKYDTNVKNNDPYQMLNRWADFFRKLAARDGYAVILVSQTSRGGYEYACKHGGQYLLTGLAESNELERGATCVITLFTNDEFRASSQISVQILKNRYGEVMLEPQSTIVRPEYYLVGNGYSKDNKQQNNSFDNIEINNDINPFNQQTQDIDLDSLLNG